jgi:uncharacterized protein (TIGR03083 family)
LPSDDIYTWIRAERLGLADFLDELDDHEWRTDSLCPGWTVHDVAAHLTLATRTTLPIAIRAAIRARGNFNRMTADLARDWASRFDRAALTTQLRQTAGSTRRAPGAGPVDLLVDVLVHGQDIARPLGRTRPMPVEPTIRAVEYARHSKLYGAPQRFAGTRLVATDCEWSAGEGPHEVHGPAGDLLMVATGRAAGRKTLTGSGLDRVAARL